MGKQILKIGVALMLLGSGHYQALAVSTEALLQGIPSLAPMLERVIPAVVSIRVSKALPTEQSYIVEGRRLPDEIRRYFNNQSESQPRPQSELKQRYAIGAGSGVIVDAQAGYVITNHHVIEGANSITVQLSDGRSLQATLIGSDEATDIALLQIEAEGLADIQLADPNTVAVGDYVVAIGNPFGIGQTVTSGIVSALGRAGLNSNNYEDFIQTDAAINLGNSGGALIDMEGHLIGINTAIISGNGGSNGIGFAVPGDMVSAVMEHLERDGEVRRGKLGVTITSLTPEMKEALRISAKQGALVTSVTEGSAAEAAGLQISDVIVEVDKKAITNSRELVNIIGLMRRGQEIELVVYRENDRLSLQAYVGGIDGLIANNTKPAILNNAFRGADLVALNSASELSGIEVVAVDSQSRAYSAGLRSGDVIVEANRQSVADLDSFNNVVASTDQIIALTVLRENRRLLLFVS